MTEEEQFQALIVALILEGRVEEALKRLAAYYRVEMPRIRVGVVKRHFRDAAAVYLPRRRTIVARTREAFLNPFTVLHEWYHHLRSSGGEHRGTERYADRFAQQFLAAYRKVLEA